MNRATQALAASLVAGILALASVTTVAGQTFYRWTDDRGHTVHSDRPPPKGVEYEVISTQSSLVREVDAEEGAVPLDVEPSVSNSFDAVDTNPTIVEKNSEFCQRARDNIEALDSGVQVQMRDKQGELRAITEDERAIQRQKAMDTIAVHCE